MAQQFLHRTKVGASLEQVGGRGVAQSVGADVGSSRHLGDPAVHELAHDPLVDAPPAGAEEERRARALDAQHRPAQPYPAKGISLFGVDTTLDGFSVGRVLDKVGQDESDTAELAFDDVRVSSADLIGPLDTGFISMMQFLPQERLGSAVTDLAHARQILEETVQYAKDRKAFGQPIGSFQNTQFLLADLVTRIDVTQAYVDHCVQIHGGYGYMNEYRVARARRDARVTKIWAGSNEIMKMLIGRDLGL